MTSLDAFTLGYIECALWTEEADDSDLSDIPAETLGEMVADCADFQTCNRALLDIANEEGRPDSHLGHDFWLSRNRHGTGFWDRGLSVGDALHEMAKPYGEYFLPMGRNITND